MADAPSAPSTLRCPRCSFFIVVNARGARGQDPGSGVEAAEIMRDHVEVEHSLSWVEALLEMEKR